MRKKPRAHCSLTILLLRSFPAPSDEALFVRCAHSSRRGFLPGQQAREMPNAVNSLVRVQFPEAVLELSGTFSTEGAA